MRSIEIPQPNERDWRYRSLEILPGVMTYTILALPIILSIVNARLAAFLVIIFLLIWFVRALAIAARSIQGWGKLQHYMEQPWPMLNADLEALAPNHKSAPKWHFKNLQRVERNIPPSSRVKPSQIYHVLMVAFYNESREVLEPTIKSVLKSDYDPQKMILFVAYEERGGADTEALAKAMIKEYGDQFFYAEAVKHPDGLPNEVRGKGGNITFAGRRLQKYILTAGIQPEHVLVTTLDADNRPHPQYLPALTYTYCSTEEPLYASYQPIPIFLNNIWDAPAPMRVVATGNSFWNIMLSLRPHMLRNFSSHAQPLSSLIETDFWSTRTIVEDGHQYWRSFFRFDGKHDVFPIFIPIYQDAVLAETYKKTIRAQFKQVQRWAWGCSDIAYVFNNGFLKKNKVPRALMLARFGRLFESHLSWSTTPLILLIAAYPPFLFHPNSYLANQLPHIVSWIQRILMAGILVSLFLSMRSLPPRPERYKRRRTLWMVLQWIYLPFTTIIFSSFAAINSQTRLMFGKYLGFNVTEKAVKK